MAGVIASVLKNFLSYSYETKVIGVIITHDVAFKLFVRNYSALQKCKKCSVSVYNNNKCNCCMPSALHVFRFLSKIYPQDIVNELHLETKRISFKKSKAII